MIRRDRASSARALAARLHTRPVLAATLLVVVVVAVHGCAQGRTGGRRAAADEGARRDSTARDAVRAGKRQGGPRGALRRTRRGEPQGASPAGMARRRLQALHHMRWVTGDIEGTRRGLGALLDDPRAPARYRAEAALRLAEIAEIAGERRGALAHLTRVASIVGHTHALAFTADDRRKRIRSTAPIIDVRGPAPGTTLVGTSVAVAALFRRAERRLVRFHRVIVAPRLENIDAVLRTKRGALAAAIKAYQAVIERGGPRSRAAALYRIASMYHHLAEAIAFDTPPEMKRSVAEKLMRRLRGKSAQYLHKALAHYTRAASVQEPSARRWRRLAHHERVTLARVVSRKR